MSKHYDLLVKKSVHFNLTKDSHTALKMACAQRGLSMQEVLEECAIRIAGQDNYMDKMLDDLVERKITGERKIAESDAQSLYRLIEAKDEEE